MTRDLRAGTVWLRCAAGPLQVAFERVGPGIRLAGAGYDDRQDERDEGHGVQHDAYDLADPDVAVRTGKGTIDGGAVVICTRRAGGHRDRRRRVRDRPRPRPLREQVR
ncbi:MAG: hypothetical protein R2736_23310 [Solirubrobacterales bacterium]